MTAQLGHIVHPESFRSNAQNANAFACRNRPRVERNDEFACVYLRSFASMHLRSFASMHLRSFASMHLRSFASTVCDRPHARTSVRTRARTYIDQVWAWHNFFFFIKKIISDRKYTMKGI